MLLGAPTRDTRNRHPGISKDPTKTHALTVAPRVTERMSQPGPRGLSAQPSVRSAAIAAETTTMRGYVEPSTIRSHTAPSRRTLSLTPYVTSPPKPTPKQTPWTTTSTKKKHGAGPGGSPNHNPSSGYRCAPPGRSTIISDTH